MPDGSFISNDLKRRANDAWDVSWSYRNRRDQGGLNGCCTAMWKADGKNTTLLLFLDSLFPKTETKIKKISFSAFFHPSLQSLRHKSCSIHKHGAEIPPLTPYKSHRPSICYAAVMSVKHVGSLPERKANEHSTTLIFQAFPHIFKYWVLSGNNTTKQK